MKNTTKILAELLEGCSIIVEGETVGTIQEGTKYFLEAQVDLQESGYIYSVKLYQKLAPEVHAHTLQLIPLTPKQEQEIAEMLLAEFPEDQEKDYPHEVFDGCKEYGVSESDFISYNHK